MTQPQFPILNDINIDLARIEVNPQSGDWRLAPFTRGTAEPLPLYPLRGTGITTHELALSGFDATEHYSYNCPAPDVLASYTTTRSNRKTWRLSMKLTLIDCSRLLVIMLACYSQLSAQTQCASLQKEYAELVNQMVQSVGCSKSNKPKPIPMQIDVNGYDPGDPDCNQQNQQALRKAWIAAHPQFTQIQNQLAKSCWAPDPCASSQISAPKTSTDLDDDGIPDVQEAALIKRFAPYVRFNKGEDRRPMDFTQFVKQSNLVTPNHFTSGDDQVFIENSFLAKTPLAVESYKGYQGTSLIDSFSVNSDGRTCSSEGYLMYAIHPYVGDWKGGAAWTQVSNANLPGMVAHVSPFVPDSLSDLPGEHFDPKTSAPTGPECALRKDKDKCPDPKNPNAPSCAVIPPSHYVKTCKHCVKIEYYQFFGLNDTHHAGIADHEGDLSIVTVVYDPDLPKAGAGSPGGAVGVSHWVHGIEIRYDLTDPGSHCILQSPEMVCKGINAGTPNYELIGDNFKTKHLNQISLAQNNNITFHADLDNPNQQVPEHPEVFPELGSHEFWPSARGYVEGGNDHKGDDAAHTFLPQNIPNLGEIEHPFGDLGKLVVNFKGKWGATGGDSLNLSSPGPSLHQAWNWFVHAPRLPISCQNAE